MTVDTGKVEKTREPVLNPVDRVSEMLFGLFMALTFIGAVSVAEPRDAQVHALFIAALGCNLAWGLVDAVMYLVRTITDRGRLLTVIRSVRDAPDAAAGRALIEQSLSRVAAGLVSSAEIEGCQHRFIGPPTAHAEDRRPGTGGRDPAGWGSSRGDETACG